MARQENMPSLGSTASDQFGLPLDSALARRERLANMADYNFGQDRLFPELVEALLHEVPEGANVLEVGAASGLLTRPLLERAGYLTALEPSAGMLRRLLETEVAGSPRLSVVQGMVEDMPAENFFDAAVVTFTPRRGVGLLRLLLELSMRVIDRVVMLLETEGTLDWAYLTRAAASQGFDIRLHMVTSSPDEHGARKHAAVFVADVGGWEPSMPAQDAWAVSDARELSVPYPSPRGAATRLVRYFLNGGDRAILVQTDVRGVERLYGNLRTAAHRLAKDEITVRRHGDQIQLVRLPKAEDEAEPFE
jgi:SAM-dependent methyltransferase